MTDSKDMLVTADELIGIQEDLPNEDDRAALGRAAHYLRKYSPPAAQQPALDREQIAAVLFMTRYSHVTWLDASGDETATAYRQADAIIGLLPLLSTYCTCIPIEPTRHAESCPLRSTSMGRDAPVDINTKSCPQTRHMTGQQVEALHRPVGEPR